MDHHADHDDPLADAFFRHPDKPVIDVWEDDHAPVVHTMSRGSRRAMFASIGIFAVATIGISAYSIYQNWIMPTPVELGVVAGDAPALLPVPTHTPTPVVTETARVETKVHPATEPAPVPTPASAPAPAAPPPETLAAFVARPSSPEPSADSAKLEGVTVAHLAATSAAIAPQPIAVAPTGAIAAPKPAVYAPPPAAPTPASSATQVTPGAPTYDELVAAGQSLSKKNRRVEASEAFRRALLKTPHGSAALSGLGFLYLNADDTQAARSYAQRSVESDATNSEGWIVLGAALEMLGDRAAAQEAYRNCVAQGKGPYLLECRRVAR